jgi:hypothetical protein
MQKAVVMVFQNWFAVQITSKSLFKFDGYATTGNQF